jgi:uncharacterized protein YraI
MKSIIILTLKLPTRLLPMRKSLNSRLRLLLIMGSLWLCMLALAWTPGAAKQSEDPSATPNPNAGGAYITVTYIEPINVRAGPSSFDYPVIGSIEVGGTAPAIGRSKAGEWIQISFPTGPKGIGWVYAFNVKLSPNALLPIVEPPPTAVPLITSTVNPTFVAALQAVPTNTRKPTFTAPPPLDIPTFAPASNNLPGGLPIGWVAGGLVAVGLLGLAISALRRR